MAVRTASKSAAFAVSNAHPNSVSGTFLGTMSVFAFNENRVLDGQTLKGTQEIAAHHFTLRR